MGLDGEKREVEDRRMKRRREGRGQSKKIR